MKNLGREFFERKPEKVAQELLGKLLIHKENDRVWVGRVVETEAYLGPGDKASHSHRGMTPRNEVMFGPAGFSYVYFTYGMHWLLNIITEKEGHPSGVLIRALEPLWDESHPITEAKLANGPAKLTRWMEINGELNKIDITKSNQLFMSEEFSVDGKSFKAEKVKPENTVATTRVGVDYAGEHKDLLLRYYINGSKFISKA
jgi:DNA-3-methyladenine glycosylase